MRGRLVMCALALLALSGCRTAAEIAIDLDESGAGHVSVQVELDEAAAARVGDLTDLVAAADLEQAGWEVSVTDRRVSARKPVASPRGLEIALRELGPPFSGLSFDRRQTFSRTSVEVGGRVDFSQGVASFGDADLQRLTGSVTGVDIAPQTLGLALTVNLPGQEDTNLASTGDAPPRWELPLGAVTAVEARSTDVNAIGLTAVVVALACGLVLLGALVRRLRP